MADQYRYQNLTPDEINRIRGLYDSYGMRSLPLEYGAETFNQLPVEKRQKLFSTIRNSQEDTLDPSLLYTSSEQKPTDNAVTVTRIGNRSFEEPTATSVAPPAPAAGNAPITVEDLQRQGFTVGEPSFSVPKSILTVEDLIEQGYNIPETAPTAGELAEAAQAGLTRGAIEGGLTTAGIVGGLKAGAALAPFSGPLAPFMPAAGALVGFGGSLLANIAAEEELDKSRPKDKEAQSYYEGSRTLGSGLMGGFTAYGLPSATAKSGSFGRLIGQIGDFARNNRQAYYAREAIISAYAGLYGGLATEVLPPDQFPIAGPLVKMGAELSASIPFLSPGRMASDLYFLGRTTAGANYNINTENKVAKTLQDILSGEGKDPTVVADELAAALANRPIDPKTGKPVKLTTSQLIDAPELTALEKELARNNARFTKETVQMGEDGLKLYASVVARLKDSGDPQLIKQAIALEEARIKANFDMAFDQATFNAAQKAATLGYRDTKDRVATAGVLTDEIQKINKVARETEQNVWSKVIENSFRLNSRGKYVPTTIKATNLTKEFLEFAVGREGVTGTQLRRDYGIVPSEMANMGLKVKKAKKDYAKVMATEDYQKAPVGKVPDSVMSGVDVPNMKVADLVKFRKMLLGKSRTLAGENDLDGARRYQQLANAVLADLEKLDSPVYSQAIAFSRQYNDAITRTFAGKLDDVDGSGRLRLPPEVIIAKTLSGGADAAYMKMREITEAAKYSQVLADAGADIDPLATINTVLGAQRRMLRAVAAETTKEVNGQRLIDEEKFRAFMDKNRSLISELGMTNEFKDIASAQRALLDLQSTKATQTLRQQKIFADLMDKDDPYYPIVKALRGGSAVIETRKVLKKIADSPLTDAQKVDAREGFKSLMLQYAENRAGGADNFNYVKYRDALYKPVREGSSVTVMGLLRSEGLITPQEEKNLQALLTPMANIQRSLDANRLLDESILPTGAMSTIEELALTQLAARVAGMVSPGGPGSLSFAQRLIRRSERLFKNMPYQKQMELLREAAKDPELAAQLLRKDLSPYEKRNLGMKIMGVLFSPSIAPTAFQRYVQQPTPEELEEDRRYREERLKPKPSSAAQELQNMQQVYEQQPPRPRPPAPTTRGMPGLPPGGGGPPPAGGGAPPTSQSRMMLQQLFPNDAITGAAAMQAGVPPMPG